jgi:hypothetical protein
MKVECRVERFQAFRHRGLYFSCRHHIVVSWWVQLHKGAHAKGGKNTQLFPGRCIGFLVLMQNNNNNNNNNPTSAT